MIHAPDPMSKTPTIRGSATSAAATNAEVERAKKR
jgi:hypothetical protein